MLILPDGRNKGISKMGRAEEEERQRRREIGREGDRKIGKEERNRPGGPKVPFLCKKLTTFLFVNTYFRTISFFFQRQVLGDLIRVSYKIIYAS